VAGQIAWRNNLKKTLVLLAFSAALLPAAEPAEKAKQPDTQIRYSREKLDKLRASLAAQIAVFDSAENALRSPSPAEASALAGPQAAAPAIRQLSGGGIAVSGPQSGVNFLVVRKSADGSVSFSHSTKPTQGGSANAR
jgi:hypothetical protein